MRIFNAIWQQQAPWLSYARFRQSSTVRKVDQAHFALNGKIGGISEFRAMLAQQIADDLIEAHVVAAFDEASRHLGGESILIFVWKRRSL